MDLEGNPVKSSNVLFINALAVPAMAALGGAAMVFSEYDDAPGGILIGLLLILAAAVLGWRAGRSG